MKIKEKMKIGLVNGLVDGLVDMQKTMLKLMQENPQIPVKILATTLGISTTAVDKHIKALKKQDLIRRVGNTKSGHWEVLL